MMYITRVLYDIGIQGYGFLIRLAAPFHKKAAMWIAGRRHLWAKIENQLQDSDNKLRVWVHCASLGEFEQGRPLMEGIRAQYPGVEIILTFFSPSGYEIRKNYAGADYVCYLPLDTPRHAERFIDCIKPSLVLFVKYEFWYHYLKVLHVRKIPVLLIAAIFRKDQLFFKSYGGFFRNVLEYYDRVFAQDESSLALLRSIRLQNSVLSGDTRFDRVAAIARSAPAFPDIDRFLSGQKALIAGSTWPPDEALLAAYFKKDHPSFKWIIAPHEINEAHLKQTEARFGAGIIRYSAWQHEKNEKKYSILLIDNIGMLSALYQYGFAAYIGGGFGQGIHNVLEAAVFGMPVFFGPRYDKFREAKALIATGSAFPVKDEKDFKEAFSKILMPGNQRAIAAQAADYVKKQTGATRQILDYIAEKRFLTRL